MPTYNHWVPTWESINWSISQNRSLLSWSWRTWVSAIPTDLCFLWFCSSQEFGETWNMLGKWGLCQGHATYFNSQICQKSSSCSLRKVQPKFSRVALRSQCLISQQLWLSWGFSPALGWSELPMVVPRAAAVQDWALGAVVFPAPAPFRALGR